MFNHANYSCQLGVLNGNLLKLVTVGSASNGPQYRCSPTFQECSHLASIIFIERMTLHVSSFQCPNYDLHLGFSATAHQGVDFLNICSLRSLYIDPRTATWFIHHVLSILDHMIAPCISLWRIRVMLHLFPVAQFKIVLASSIEHQPDAKRDYTRSVQFYCEQAKISMIFHFFYNINWAAFISSFIFGDINSQHNCTRTTFSSLVPLTEYKPATTWPEPYWELFSFSVKLLPIKFY